MTATAGNLAGSPITFTATGIAGPATVIALTTGDKQSGLIGTALPQPFVVTVRDKNANLVPGFTVAFKVVLGGGTLVPADGIVKTAANGTASAKLTLGAAAGSNTVTANADDLGPCLNSRRACSRSP